MVTLDHAPCPARGAVSAGSEQDPATLTPLMVEAFGAEMVNVEGMSPASSHSRR